MTAVLWLLRKGLNSKAHKYTTAWKCAIKIVFELQYLFCAASPTVTVFLVCLVNFD